jgi:hypothetical protein
MLAQTRLVEITYFFLPYTAHQPATNDNGLNNHLECLPASTTNLDTPPVPTPFLALVELIFYVFGVFILGLGIAFLLKPVLGNKLRGVRNSTATSKNVQCGLK